MRILVACFAKSGSTFFTELIGHLPGFKVESYVPEYDRREQELCETTILNCNGSNQVAQHHVRASRHTLDLIRRFEITPIVLVRNIFDAVVSLADHIQRDSPIFPMAYFDATTAQLPLHERIDAVLDLALPWYLNFYASWWHARRDAIVTYEDVVLGPPQRKSAFLRAVGIPASDSDVDLALRKIDSGRTRLNVGRQGRGLELITPDRRQKVFDLTRYYPDIDFSPIGLSAIRTP